MPQVAVDAPLDEFQEGVNPGRFFAVNAGREDDAGKVAGIIAGHGRVQGMDAVIGGDPAGLDPGDARSFFF